MLSRAACLGVAAVLALADASRAQTGSDGGPGEDGGSVVVDEVLTDSVTEVAPTGGAGGVGTSNLAPGAGGHVDATYRVGPTPSIVRVEALGGDGGDARGTPFAPGAAGTATTSILAAGRAPFYLDASATGGAGGASDLVGGDGGTATLGPLTAISDFNLVWIVGVVTGGEGGLGPTRGRGGSVLVENAVYGESPQSVFLEQNAIGGEGSVGGDATSILHTSSDSDIEARVGATSGFGFDTAGRARSEVAIRGEDADVFIEARALAGRRPGSRGPSGDTSVSATGIATGSGNVEIVAAASGGRTEAALTATGIAEGSGNVDIDVEVRPGGGHSVVGGVSGVALGGGDVTIRALISNPVAGVVNAVTGSTSGNLSIVQDVLGAPSVLSHTGSSEHIHLEAVSRLGEAEASSTVLNDTGGATAVARAFDSVTRDASVSAVAVGAGAKPVEALADAEIGSTEAGLGNLALGPVSATSLDGGSVSASLLVSAVNRTSRVVDIGPNSVDLYNAVEGSSSGEVSLTQTAWGLGAAPSNPSILVEGGDASSVLERSQSSESLSLSVEALGGEGIRAGDALATTFGENPTGRLSATAKADGGLSRGAGSLDALGGGDAHAGARAVASGDVDVFAEAQGGRATGSVTAGNATLGQVVGISTGGGAIAVTGIARGGNGIGLDNRGGLAASGSLGRSSYDGAVHVQDLAQGGDARRSTIGGDTVGDGGGATSSAEAENQGTSRVEASSTAIGGSGGFRQNRSPVTDPIFGVGGDAHAESIARGKGEVLAQATAAGGDSLGAQAPRAMARASAFGSSGTAAVETSTSSGAGLLGIRLESGVMRSASVESEVGEALGASLTSQTSVPEKPAQSHLDARAFGTVLPEAGGFAEMDFGLWPGEGSDGSGSLAMDFALADLEAAGVRGVETEPVELSLLFDEGSGSGLGLDAMHLVLDVAGVSILDEIFGTITEAKSFFTDNLVPIGSFDPGDGLLLTLDWVSSKKDWHFEGNVEIAAVPEPTTGVLLVAALLLAVRSDSRSRAAARSRARW